MKTNVKKLIGIPLAGLALIASEQTLSANLQCGGWADHDCAVLYNGSGYFGCTNQPGTWGGTYEEYRSVNKHCVAS